jgi:hypothetical protein
MQKKTDIQDLDIPKDDIECWERYPKHHWVYDLSRLLDAQHIKWSPYETPDLPDKTRNMYFESQKDFIYEPAAIYIAEPEGENVWTEVFITKGEIKHMRHIDIKTRTEIPGLLGEIELRINAFVTLHFQKFTGIISVQSVGTDIYSIRLRPVSELALEANVDVFKLIKRIYKKNELNHVIGPTGQVFHEQLAS